MVSITAPSASFTNFRRLIPAPSLSAGDLQLGPFHGLEWKSTGIFKGQKRKSVVELGTERVVNAEANVLSTVLLYPMKFYLLSDSQSGPVSFCLINGVFINFSIIIVYKV